MWFARSQMAPASGPSVSFPDPSFEDETGYTVSGDAAKIPGGFSFDGSGSIGFVNVETTGTLDTEAMSSIPDNTACMVSFNIANYVAEGGTMTVALKDGTPVLIGASANGWTTPVAVTSGNATPALQLLDSTGFPAFDITAIDLDAA